MTTCGLSGAAPAGRHEGGQKLSNVLICLKSILRGM